MSATDVPDAQFRIFLAQPDFWGLADSGTGGRTRSDVEGLGATRAGEIALHDFVCHYNLFVTMIIFLGVLGGCP